MDMENIWIRQLSTLTIHIARKLCVTIAARTRVRVEVRSAQPFFLKCVCVLPLNNTGYQTSSSSGTPTCDGSTRVVCACGGNPSISNAASNTCANTPAQQTCPSSQIQCNANHVFESGPRCGSNGAWETSGSCRPIQCSLDDVPTIGNSQSFTSSVNPPLRYGDTVSVVCRSGYTTTSTGSSITCVADNTYNTNGVQCVERSCSNNPSSVSISNIDQSATQCDGTYFFYRERN